MKLTPRQDLMVDVLVARTRLGEPCWTFEGRHAGVAMSLEELGLVTWKTGIVEKTIIVWPTDALLDEFMSTGYVPPILR